MEHRTVQWNPIEYFRILGVPDHHWIPLDDGADVWALLVHPFRRHMHHIREENAVHTLGNEVQDMAMDQFGREADGIRRYELKAGLIVFPAGIVGQHHVVSQAPEEYTPEGIAVPKLQHTGDADGDALVRGKTIYRYILEQMLISPSKEVFGLFNRAFCLCVTGSFLASVSADEAPSGGETHGGEGAVVLAPAAADAAPGFPGEGLQRVEADEM